MQTWIMEGLTEADPGRGMTLPRQTWMGEGPIKSDRGEGRALPRQTWIRGGAYQVRPGEGEGLTEADLGVAGLALPVEAAAGRRGAAPRAVLLTSATADRAGGPRGPGQPAPRRVYKHRRHGAQRPSRPPAESTHTDDMGLRDMDVSDQGFVMLGGLDP